MTFRIDDVRADETTIDRYCGPGAYRLWKEQVAQAKVTLSNYERLDKRIPLQLEPYLEGNAAFDATYLEALSNDYSSAIALIQQGKKVDLNQLDKIIELQAGYLAVLDKENANIQAVLDIGFFAEWMDFQFRNIERAAIEALPKIAARRFALNEAKRKALESEVQTVVDTGLFILGFFEPQLAVATKITIAVGQWAMDDYLGGNKSTSTKDDLSNVSSGSGVVHAALENWKWLEAKAGKTGITIGGKAIAITGLYFDADEVGTALDKVGVARRTLAAAVQALEVVKAQLERQRGAMMHLKATLRKVSQVFDASHETIDRAHLELTNLRQRANWTTKPVAWRIAS